MATRTYNGIAYRQQPHESTPWIVSFVASAEEIFTWAGLPRRSEEGLIGFQRLDEEPRVERARDFFKQSVYNQSPTSIVLGIHPVAAGGTSPITLQLLDSENANIRPCILTVEVPDEISVSRVCDILRSQIERRLRDDSDEADASPLDDLGEDIEEIEDDEGPEDDDESESAKDVELGRSLLNDLLQKLDDQFWCTANEADLRDLAKPATVIDGQHRLKGAELCERNIPFSVCAIFNCPWPEQVFQFTVVNYTAQGIPDQFITANAALSLTANELGMLQNRLIQAGVKVTEYELMRVINFDSESPFYNAVNLTTKSSLGKIGYKTMVAVGRGWFSGRKPAVNQIIDHLHPELTGKKGLIKKKKLDLWKQEDWGWFFKDFWNVVRDEYAPVKTVNGDSLWTVGKSNLMIAVVLLELQDAFLTNLTAQDESFFEVEGDDATLELRQRIRSRAKRFLGYIPANLFAIEWETKSLSTSVGRDLLKTTLRKLADSKGNFKYANSGLVTGKTG